METLVKRLKKFVRKKEIIDLVIFGSYAKGKKEASEIDIAVIYEEPFDKSAFKREIIAIIPKKIDIQYITAKDYDKPLWITVIREGFSIKHNAYLHEVYRMKPLVVYKYSLKSLTPSKKVMFERALKNFGHAERVSNQIVFVPVKYASDFSMLLKHWKIDVDAREYSLLPLMRKEEY